MNFILSKEKTESSVQIRICNPTPYIPSSVISDILSYLPLKTVVQSKIVCKEWKRLISDPEFAKFYFAKSPPGLFLLSEIFGNVLHYVDLRDSSLRYKLCGDMHIPHKAIVGRFLSRKIDFSKSLILSCNGFLCFCETGPSPSPRYYICNPITRDYIIVPSEKIPEKHWRSEFGFSPKTGQYKVLSLWFSSACDKLTAMIFTLGQTSWRSIEVSNNFDPCGTTAFLNGTFHWVSSREMLLSFDVGAETFQEFPFPPKYDFGDRTITSFIYSLGILEECLSLSRSSASAVMGLTEIWMLKDYGVTESWSKYFVISDLNFVGRVLWFMEDGKRGNKVLFVCEHSTVSYDTAERVCSYLKFDGLLGDVTLVPHTPNLTPLKDVIIFDENSKGEIDTVPLEQRGVHARAIRDIRRPNVLNPLNQSSWINILRKRGLRNRFLTGTLSESSKAAAMRLLKGFSPECEVDKSLFNWAQGLGFIIFPRGPPPASGDLFIHSPPASGDLSIHSPPASADLSIHSPPASGDLSIHSPPASGDLSIHSPPAITTGDLPINNDDIPSDDDDDDDDDGDDDDDNNGDNDGDDDVGDGDDGDDDDDDDDDDDNDDNDVNGGSPFD